MNARPSEIPEPPDDRQTADRDAVHRARIDGGIRTRLAHAMWLRDTTPSTAAQTGGYVWEFADRIAIGAVPAIQAAALRDAADAWESLDPGKPSPIGEWLRNRATQIDHGALPAASQPPGTASGPEGDSESRPAHAEPVEAPSTPCEEDPGLAEVKAALTEFGENLLETARAAWASIRPVLDAAGVQWTAPDPDDENLVIDVAPDPTAFHEAVAKTKESRHRRRAETFRAAYHAENRLRLDAEAKVAELTSDCDELTTKNRTVIQQGADALARATRAEAQVQRVRNAIASATWPSAMVRAQIIRDAIEQPKETDHV